jgi:hypothetical protein
MAVAQHRRLAIRIVCGFIGVLAGSALSMVASWLAAEVIPASVGWVQGEAGLWLSALLVLLVTGAWHTRSRVSRRS